MANEFYLSTIDKPQTLAKPPAYVNLGASPYIIQDFTIGDVVLDSYNRLVQQISLTLTIKGADIPSSIKALNDVNFFMEGLDDYISFPENLTGSRLDGKYHYGFAPVLTMKVNGATEYTYWDILNGNISQPVNQIQFNNAVMAGVKLDMICVAGGRSYQRRLQNLIPGGDFMPPFTKVSGGGTNGMGWTMTSGWSIAYFTNISDNSIARYGNTDFYLSSGDSTNSSQLYTPEFTHPYRSLAGSTWLYFLTNHFDGDPSGYFQVRLEYYDTTTSTWVTDKILFNLNQPDTLAQGANTWFQVGGTVTNPTKRNRMVFDCSKLWINFGSWIYVNGVGAWADYHDQNGNLSWPTTEYMAQGSTLDQPYVNIYGIQGNMTVPARLEYDGLTLDQTNPSVWQQRRLIVLGGRRYRGPMFEKPLDGMLFNLNTGSTVTGVLGGNLGGVVSSGAATTSTYFASPPLGATTLDVDRITRQYQLFIVYASNMAIDKVQVFLGRESKYYTEGLPATYSGTTNPPTASQYRVAPLGDYEFPRPGNIWEDQTGPQPILNSGYKDGLVFYHANTSTRVMAVVGLIAIPNEQFTYLDLGDKRKKNNIIISGEGDSPRVGYTDLDLTLPVSSTANYYKSTPYELTSLSSPLPNFLGGEIRAIPSGPFAAVRNFGMRYVQYCFSDWDSFGIKATSSEAFQQIAFVYTPRYKYGMSV